MEGMNEVQLSNVEIGAFLNVNTDVLPNFIDDVTVHRRSRMNSEV